MSLTRRSAVGIALMSVSVALMLLPYGISMTFADGPTKRITSCYSYFNLISFGYGNWFPLISVTLSLVLILLFVRSLMRKTRAGGGIVMTAVFLVLSSLAAQILSGAFTAVGIAVICIHAAVLIFQYNPVKTK